MTYDAIVIGAGPAGLSAGLALGRMRRRVMLVDSGQPRNHYTEHAHNYLTRDGLSPRDLRRLGREEVERYPTVVFREGRVTAVHPRERSVEVTMEDGTHLEARRAVLAAGIADALPDIAGLAEIFGTSAFTCPYCDGYECADSALGMICTAERQIVNAAGLMRMLSDRVTIFANGTSPTIDETDAASALGVAVVEARVQRLQSVSGLLQNVVLEGGRAVPCERIFVPWRVRANALIEQSGCSLTDAGFVEIDDMGRTSVPRVYAAGDAVLPIQQVSLAVASGTRAAMAINHDAIVANEVL